MPTECSSFQEADLTDSEVESLVLKYLLARGDASGRVIAEQVKLPFLLAEELLAQMKSDQLIGHRGSSTMNDYVFQLSGTGLERARRVSEHCTYLGAATVALQDYIATVDAQSLDSQHPSVGDLRGAFEDLLVNPAMLVRLGPAAGCFCSARRATAKRASPNDSPRPSGNTFGFRGRSVSTARFCSCSIPTIRRRCR